MFHVLLWDLDMTLLNFRLAERHALRRAFGTFGLGPCTDGMLDAYSRINRLYWEALERREITRPELIRGRFHDFFREAGIRFDRYEAFDVEYEARLSDRIFYMDHCVETLEALRDLGVRQYVVTNGNVPVQKARLRKSGLDRLFDAVFISGELGAEKPSRAFFEAVRERVGPLEKETTLIIGDSLTGDILGGIHAGIRTCWYNPERKRNTKKIPADYEIRDLREVLSLVR